MTILLFFAFAILALGALWWFVLRPVVRQWFAHDAEALRSLSLTHIRATLSGLRTVLAARLVWLGGAIVGLHDYLLPYVAGVDWTPLTANVPAWWLPIAAVATGATFEWLRRLTAPVPPAGQIETLD